MNITTIILLPLMAYVLNKRIRSVYVTYNKNIEENKSMEIFFLLLTIGLIITIIIMSELFMP